MTLTWDLEISVAFEDLTVLRADGAPVPLDDFIADGHGVWDALHAHDERMSGEAQGKAQRRTHKWRAWAELRA